MTHCLFYGAVDILRVELGIHDPLLVIQSVIARQDVADDARGCKQQQSL